MCANSRNTLKRAVLLGSQRLDSRRRISAIAFAGPRRVRAPRSSSPNESQIRAVLAQTSNAHAEAGAHAGVSRQALYRPAAALRLSQPHGWLRNTRRSESTRGAALLLMLLRGRLHGARDRRP
jgi:hypothetical protein